MMMIKDGNLLSFLPTTTTTRDAWSSLQNKKKVIPDLHHLPIMDDEEVEEIRKHHPDSLASIITASGSIITWDEDVNNKGRGLQPHPKAFKWYKKIFADAATGDSDRYCFYLKRFGQHRQFPVGTVSCKTYQELIQARKFDEFCRLIHKKDEEDKEEVVSWSGLVGVVVVVTVMVVVVVVVSVVVVVVVVVVVIMVGVARSRGGA